MRNTIIVILFFIHQLAIGQAKIDCDKIIDDDLFYVKADEKDGNDALRKDLEILKACGNINSSLDVQMLGPLIGVFLVDQMKRDKAAITYRLLFMYIKEYKATENYKRMSEMLSASNELNTRKADTKNWENDKPLLLKLGLPEDTLSSFHKFIVENNNANLTYKEALKLYAEKNERLASKPFKFKRLILFDSALAEAKATGKPLLIFFSGYTSINSRKMEEQIFSNSEVKKYFSETFLSYIAFVDEFNPLKEAEQYNSKYTGKLITTTGQRLMDLESGYFKSDSQPFLVIVDHEGKILRQTRYTSDVNEFLSFLKGEK